MKKFISHLMMLVFMTSFFACTSETEDAGGNLGNKVSVRMNFTGLNGFATSRAVDNTAIENLTMYLFTGSDEGASLAYTLPVTLDETTANGCPGSFEVPEAGTYYMVAIANHTALSGIKTYADLLAQTTGTAIANNLIMQGNLSETVTLRAGGETKLTMELVRLAAMFQVTNESDLANVTFTLKDAVQTSYFVKHDAEGSFTIPADAQTGENTEPYAYENPASGTTMAISGTLNGATYKAEVPFGQVLRNHLYTVKLTKVGNEIKPTVTVTDWSTLSASMTINAGDELKMTATTDATAVAEVVYPATAPEVSQQTVTVPEEGQTYKLWVGSANIEAAVTNTTLPEGWTLTNPDGSSRADYLWQDYYYTLTIPANTSSDAKSVTITATNKLNDKATVSITFTLEGKVEESIWNENGVEKVLSKFSTANLKLRYIQGVGNQNFIPTTATSFDPTNGADNSTHPQNLTNNGYRYQWGRNYGFMSSVVDGVFITDLTNPAGSYYGYAIGPGKIAQCNNSTYLTKYICITDNVSTQLDYASDHQNDSKWADRGLNGKEPCPSGYRLPTKAEFEKLVPTGKIDVSGVNFTNPNLVIIAAEIVNPGTDDAVAMQWAVTTREWWYQETAYIGYDIYQTHLVITSVPVKKTATTVDKNDPIFTTATNRVMRNFPANGCYINNGKSFNWGEFGGYWTADAVVGEQKSWAFEFGETIAGDGPFTISMKEEHRVRALNVRCVKAE